MSDSQKTKILIVDDLAEKLLVYQVILQELGQELVFAQLRYAPDGLELRIVPAGCEQGVPSLGSHRSTYIRASLPRYPYLFVCVCVCMGEESALH